MRANAEEVAEQSDHLIPGWLTAPLFRTCLSACADVFYSLTHLPTNAAIP